MKGLQMTYAVRNERSRLLNRVPEVTVYFWIIKVLCTTVGETASDFLNVNLNLGLVGTSLATGVLLMLAAGISPLSGGPRLDVGSIVADIASLQPAGFLWVGLITVIATPITRVIAAAVGFGLVGEWRMVLIAVAIVGVIGLSIVTALAGG